jgi:hypothetical protein
VTRRTIVIAALGLLVLSGIAGVATGGASAQADWWLIVVCGTLLVGVVTTKVV